MSTKIKVFRWSYGRTPNLFFLGKVMRWHDPQYNVVATVQDFSDIPAGGLFLDLPERRYGKIFRFVTTGWE